MDVGAKGLDYYHHSRHLPAGRRERAWPIATPGSAPSPPTSSKSSPVSASKTTSPRNFFSAHRPWKTATYFEQPFARSLTTLYQDERQDSVPLLEHSLSVPAGCHQCIRQ